LRTMMRWQGRTGETRTGRGPHEDVTVPEVELLGYGDHGAQPQSVMPRPGFSLPTGGGRTGGGCVSLRAGRRIKAASSVSQRPSLDP
jgi:hypothetical protein